MATGDDIPVAYLVMEYVDGEPLSAQLARDGRLPAARWRWPKRTGSGWCTAT